MTRKVLLAQFMHETNTFCKRITAESAFRGFYCHEGDAVPDALAGTQNEVAGVIDIARAQGWRLVTPVATFATPGGPVGADAWAAFATAILRAARDQGPFDAAILSLHGAMVLSDGGDGDARLVAELRQILGPRVPIAVTLDLHANLAPEMAATADAILSYRTFPHVDMAETGRRAARIVAQALAGRGPRPQTVIRKLPMITMPEGGRTDRPPMAGLMAEAEALSQTQSQDRAAGVLDVSLNAGFSFSDVPEIGPSVTVVHAGAPERAMQIADALAARVWAARDSEQEKLLTPEVAAELARDHAPGGAGPLVLADIADNPGDGAYGDSTALLGALVAVEVEDALLGALHDPLSVAAADRAGTGARLDLELGGRCDPRRGGGPLRVKAEVLHLGDGNFVCGGPMWQGVAQSAGRTALLRIGGVRVLVTSLAIQALDLEIFRSNGADPACARVVALKSAQHFRAAYSPIAGRIVLVDGGGLASPRLDRLTYGRVPRPIHPLDDFPSDIPGDPFKNGH